MDWGAVLKFTAIGGAIIVAAVLAVLIFDAIWVRTGLGAAILVLVGALYVVKRRSDRNAERQRKKWERA